MPPDLSAGVGGFRIALVQPTNDGSRTKVGSIWAARSSPTAELAQALAFFAWNSTVWRVNLAQSFVRSSTANWRVASAERL